MKSKSFLLFLISIGIWIITFGLAFIRPSLDFDVIVLGVVGSFSLGTSFAGFIIGFFDKSSITKYIGILGNTFLLAVAFVFIFFTSADSIDDEPELTYHQFINKLPESLQETEIDVNFRLLTDTVDTWDSLKIQYWLKGDQVCKKVAKDLRIEYEKVFLHYPDGFGDQVEEFSVSTDSVTLRVPVLNQRNSSSIYQRNVSIGIRAEFKSGAFQYDTTFLVAVKYIVRAPHTSI